MTVKQIIKAMLPGRLLKLIRKHRADSRFGEYRDLPIEQVFSKIYADKVWGDPSGPSEQFYSGSGSHADNITSAYINAVSEFFNSLDKKPNVVDLGCGDFYVGQQIRSLCGEYIACDIVPALVEFNREKYRSLDVSFRLLDLTADELPAGDVVFIRQVLQHLSNSQIQKALPGVAIRYRYLILTEHLPHAPSFKHNLDKPAGPDTRLNIESGVVLTSAPFNLKPVAEYQLCQVIDEDGIIKTTLYEFNP